MATSYPAVARTDYAADDFATQTRTRGLRDIHECMLRKPFCVYFAEATRTNVAYGDMVDWEQLVPEYWTGRTLYIVIEAKVDAGTGYWQVVDADDGDALVSDEVEVTANAYAVSTATITVPAGWTAAARRSLTIQGKADNPNTILLQCVDLIRCYVSD